MWRLVHLAQWSCFRKFSDHDFGRGLLSSCCIVFGGCSIIELVHLIFNNMVCATSKASDQPAHTHKLIRAFASRLSIL